MASCSNRVRVVTTRDYTLILDIGWSVHYDDALSLMAGFLHAITMELVTVMPIAVAGMTLR